MLLRSSNLFPVEGLVGSKKSYLAEKRADIVSESTDKIVIFGWHRRTEAYGLVPRYANVLDSGGQVEQPNRDEVIRSDFARGETLSDLARIFGLTPQRVHQIVHPT